MRTLGALIAAVALSACIVEAPSNESPDAQGASKQAVPSAAARTVKNGAILGGKVELVGATFQPGELVPGQPTRVALYFRVLDALGGDYQVFVHVEDADGQLPRTNFDHPPAGGKYPTSQWKKGDMIRDEFSIYLPPGTSARAMNILVGMWSPATMARLPLTNPQQVRNDGQSRILLAQLPVAHF